MQEIRITTEDQQIIDEICAEWEPTTHPMMAGVEDHLTHEEYSAAVNYIRDHTRRRATWAILATKIVGLGRELGMDLWGMSATQGATLEWSLFLSVEVSPTDESAAAADLRALEIADELPDNWNGDDAIFGLAFAADDAIQDRFFQADIQRSKRLDQEVNGTK